MHDLDSEDVEDLPIDEVWKLYGEVSKNVTIHENNLSVLPLELPLQLIPFDQLTFGQFIDLETYVTDNWRDKFCEIIATIYLNCTGGEWHDLQPEPFKDVNIKYRVKQLQDIEINHVYGAVQKYLKWRITFFKSYGLIDDPSETPDPLEDDEPQEEKPNSWMDILNELSNKDVTKFDKILETNVHLIYNQLIHIKNQTKIEPVPL